MAINALHMVKAGIGRLRRPAFDARASVEIAKFGLPFFPATRYALAPSALLAVLNDVAINDRRTIVELGAGYSSVYIGALLRAQSREGAAVISVDAHAGWLSQVEASARRAGCADVITPVHAPMAPFGDAGEWYDLAPILGALGDRKIDLLLVDGPVASGGANPFARAPAIPALKDRLNDRCAIFLDDAHRPSHAKIARNWGETLGLTFTEHHARGGFAHAVRGDAFDPII